MSSVRMNISHIWILKDQDCVPLCVYIYHGLRGNAGCFPKLISFQFLLVPDPEQLSVLQFPRSGWGIS